MFWNYVIPDGSTTGSVTDKNTLMFWNHVIPDGSTTTVRGTEEDYTFWNYVIPDGSTTRAHTADTPDSFGTMSFQMVLLPAYL